MVAVVVRDNNILSIKYMILLWLIIILSITPVLVYVLSRTQPKTLVSPKINPLDVSAIFDKSHYIYARGVDVSLQTTLNCVGGMEIVSNDDGTYHFKCTYLYLTYNSSDGLLSLSVTKDINSYFKILKAGDEFIITTVDEKKIMMFSKGVKKFYMLNPYTVNDVSMTENIYMTFDLNKRDYDIPYSDDPPSDCAVSVLTYLDPYEKDGNVYRDIGDIIYTGKDGAACDGSYKKTGFKSSTEAEKEMVDKGYTIAVRPYYRTTFDCEKSENCEVP